MKIILSVDKGKCIGSANCVVIAPKFFELGEDGKSQPINAEVDATPEEYEDIRKAVASCPVGAIEMEEIQ